MLAVEVYRKNYKKIKAVDALIHEATNLAFSRYEEISQLDRLMTFAWSRVTTGFKPDSILSNRKVLLEAIPPQIEEDPIKSGILKILVSEIKGINTAPIKDEVIINRKIIYPHSEFVEINMIKVFAFTIAEHGFLRVCYALSTGEIREFIKGDIFYDMIKEQISGEMKTLLKRLIRTLKKDIKLEQKQYERLKTTLEPYVVADEI